jgi:hypothetical protein
VQHIQHGDVPAVRWQGASQVQRIDTGVDQPGTLQRMVGVVDLARIEIHADIPLRTTLQAHHVAQQAQSAAQVEYGQRIARQGLQFAVIQRVAAQLGLPADAIAIGHDSKGRPLLAPSSLGLAVTGGSLSHGLKIAGASRAASDTTYELVAGKTKTVRDHYNQLSVDFQEPDGQKRQLKVIVRAYDDGVAFRYVLPAQAGAEAVNVRNEETRFDFPADYRCWGLNLGKFGSSHEGEFDPIPASRIREHNSYDLPLVCQPGDEVVHRVQLLGLNVGDLNAEFILHCHGHLDHVQRVRTEIADEVRLRLHVCKGHAELLSDDLGDAFSNGFHR